MPRLQLEPQVDYELKLIRDSTGLPKATFFVGPLALRVAGRNFTHAQRADNWFHANVALISPRAKDPEISSEGMWFHVGSVDLGNTLRIGKGALLGALKVPHHAIDRTEVDILQKQIEENVGLNHLSIQSPEERGANFITLRDLTPGSVSTLVIL